MDIMSNFTAVNIDVRVLHAGICFHFSWLYTWGAIAVSTVTLRFNILRSCQSLFQGSTQSYIPTSAFGFLTCILFKSNLLFLLWLRSLDFRKAFLSQDYKEFSCIFLLVFLWFYIAILGLCGVHPVYSLNMEPTFFFFNMSTHWSQYPLLKIPSFPLCFESPSLGHANLGLFQNILYFMSLCVSSRSNTF